MCGINCAADPTHVLLAYIETTAESSFKLHCEISIPLLHLLRPPHQSFFPNRAAPLLLSPVSSYAELIHINRYMSHLPLRSPGYTRIVCICVCLYCTFPTSLPALHPAVSCVTAEIDKLTLKALCLRSLLEWVKNTTCLQQQYENTHTHTHCIHVSLSADTQPTFDSAGGIQVKQSIIFTIWYFVKLCIQLYYENNLNDWLRWMILKSMYSFYTAMLFVEECLII